MKYVITGVDGKLGGRVAENVITHFMTQGITHANLIFTCPLPERIPAKIRERWSQLGITLRAADYDNPEQLVVAFTGGQRLFMVSGVLIGEKRVRQHKNVINAAIKAGIDHITYTSFLGATDPAYAHVYVTPDHTETEIYLRKSGINYNVMRNNLYMENYLTTSVMLSLLSGNKWYTTAGEGKATYIAKDDSALVGALLLLGKGEDKRAYNITGSESISQRDLCQLVSHVSGIPIEYCPVGKEEFFEYLDSIHIPRDTDQDFSLSPVPWCGNDMVTNEASIAEGLMDVKSDDFFTITGQHALTAKNLVVKYSYIWEKGITHWKDIL
ncbi:NmrA family NAD(P)-binding protein [Acerihabitans sp. TG2]|uniref:NmrA family NAD(P)-binding protein n=1 Tax=Acerihabitans sp. TG2 TaxID=3096008 RepID=UPI002B23D263|nr:NmrA family NAD(P)-binding protein [Acerihabitans sp. TG2]MEA9389691.1 NmrA family NAD(P)-binding protein [Acerihabitans sp. TG2]